MSDVTVGLPVYNGADTVAEAIENLLAQSYGDLTVLVSDNASTDATPDIVAALAARDSRVRLIRQPRNLGPVGNFRFLADAAETPFFAWRAHDDITDLNFIEVLRQRLIDTPQAGLAAPHTVTSKRRGDRQRPFAVRLAPGACAGWHSLGRCEAGWLYGLYRTPMARAGVAVADQAYPHVWGWDYLVIVNALLARAVTGSNQTRFIHRLHLPTTTNYRHSRAELRQIFADFYRAADGMAATHGLTGAQRVAFRARLCALIGRRIVRWQRLVV